MEGGNGKLWIPVLDLLGRLILICGFLVLFSSTTIKTGELVILLGFALSLPVDYYRAFAYRSGSNFFPSATIRRLDCAATIIQTFGSSLIFAVQLSFPLTHAKSLVWLGLTGSIIEFIGALLHAMKVYKVQQLMKEVI